MRRLSAAALFGMVVAVAGCSQESTPGGPGVSNQSSTTSSTSNTATMPANSTSTTTTANKPVITDKNNTFTLEVPKMTTSVKQGQKEDVTLSISRGSEFKENVKLEIHAPQGITVTPAEPMIQAGQSKVTVTLRAAGNAPVEKTNIQVTAVPESGKSVSLQVPVGLKRANATSESGFSVPYSFGPDSNGIGSLAVSERPCRLVPRVPQRRASTGKISLAGTNNQ